MPQRPDTLDPEGHYARLGLRRDASLSEVSAAYRARARVVHPDVPGTGSSAAFLALKQSYDVLSDPVRRAAYDRAAASEGVRAYQAAAFGFAPSPPPPPARPGAPERRGVPLAAWAGFGALLLLGLVQALLHLGSAGPEATAVPPAAPAPVTIAPLPPTAFQEALYGPAPAVLPGTPNFYVVPAAGPAILWRLDRERNALVPMGRLPLFSQVQAVRLVRQTGMLEVLLEDRATGFLQAAHLAPGNAEAARRAFCIYNAGAPPTNGEVLDGGLGGTESLRLDNAALHPVVVRLRDRSGRAVLSVFLAPGGQAEVTGVPTGDYVAEYAIGEAWSRACDGFVVGMRAMRLERAVSLPPDTRLVVAGPSGWAAREIAGESFVAR